MTPQSRMTADDDVRNFEHGHRVFDGRRASALHRAIGRHHVAGVSQDEELSRLGLRHQGRIDSGIRTGDETARAVPVSGRAG